MTRGTDITRFRRSYSERNEGDFPETITLTLKKESDKKYGENPNQHCATYTAELINSMNVSIIARLTSLKSVRTDEQGKGGLSATNEMDITKAMKVLSYFEEPAVSIMKHVIVSGFARQVHGSQTQADLFRLARDTDIKSNFGGSVVFNRPLSRETAEALYELKGKNPFFVDVLAAPDYDTGVLDYIQKESKNIRIAKFSNLKILPRFKGDNTHGLMSFKEMDTGRVAVQDLYLTSIRNPGDLILDPMVIDTSGSRHMVKKDPSPKEIDDLLASWWINLAGVRSNGIVFFKNGATVAVGAGQKERIGAIEQAIIKSYQTAMDREGIKYDPIDGAAQRRLLSKNPLEGAVMSSDAFFPFRDSIDTIAGHGVTAIIQPGGSAKDYEVIDAVNEHKMAMAYTLERCFGHF